MSALTELFEQIRSCHKCDIARNRTLAVPGEGPDNAEIMFIGEAPGFNEDLQGRPFVGQAGQFLNELIASIGLQRGGVYITNIVKSRPPGNRDPLPQEIQNCGAWLDMQLEIIRPRMVVTLGRYSMARFFPGKSISQIHGTSVAKDGVLYFAMYHPAAALHQQSLRQTLKQDMLKIPVLLAKAKAPPPVQPAQTKQLYLF